jgi:hypothetical protein
MNIEISEEEYRHLLDMLQISQWVMHAHETEEEPRTAPYDRIMQKFYALAKEMGQDQLVEYDTSVQQYFLSHEFGETSFSRDLINEFTEDIFWDQLIHRLTERDLARTLGGYDQLDALSTTERFVSEGPITAKYVQEFDERGVERLEIVESFTKTAVHGLTHD